MTDDERRDFLERALVAATEAARYYSFNPAIAAAQSALESNWGQSQLAREAMNLKGIKSGRSWTGPTIELPTREYREADDEWYTTMATWRKYDSWEHAFRDYGALIERVYPHAATLADYPRQFLEALVSGQLKYATDPAYVAKVWRIVEQYDMLAMQPTDNDDWRIIVYDSDNEITANVTIAAGATILTRVDPEHRRVHVRPDD